MSESPRQLLTHDEILTAQISTSVTIDPDGNKRTPAAAFWCWVMDPSLHWAAVLTAIHFVLSFIVLPSVLRVAAIPVACLLPISILMVVMPSRVRVGDDGILWTHWPRSFPGIFLPYSELGAVKDNPRGATIVLADGRELFFQTMVASPSDVRSAIRRRRDEWKELAGTEPVTAGLMTSVDNDPYRSLLDASALMEIAAAPRLDPELRMDAAQKLGSIGDEGTRAVLRSLSAATAEPRVRALFAKIGGGHG